MIFLKILFLTVFVGPIAFGQTSDAQSQSEIIQSIVKAGCQRKDLYNFESETCIKSWEGFPYQLINPDPVMFEKNLAGLIVHICSNFFGFSQVECFDKAIKSSKSPNLNEMLSTFFLAETYRWVFSTKLRRFIFSVGNPPRPNFLVSNLAIYLIDSSLFQKILLDFAHPQDRNIDYRTALQKNGIVPDKTYYLRKMAHH